MSPLPKKAKAKARLFDEDNKWLVREADARHTVVAVIIHEMVEERRAAAVQRKQFTSVL